MRMVARTWRAIHARAARRRPPPTKGRGHGRRGPRPLSPKGDSGPPPASASAPPPHGGHPAARPPQVGARSAGRAHSARIWPPPMRLWVRCVSRLSPSSPPPLARWAEGSARSRPPAGGDGGRSHPPASFYRVVPYASHLGCARHTRGSGFLRVATHTRLTNRSVSGKIPLRGHTGSVRSAALHVHGATKPPVFDGGLLLYLRH